MAAVQLVVLRMRVGRRMSSGTLCGTTQPYEVNECITIATNLQQIRREVQVGNLPETALG